MFSTFQNQLSENNVQVHFLVIDGAEAKTALKYSYDKHKSQKPKRNKSAFLIYSAEKRAQIKARGEKLNSNEIMAKLADLWNNLPLTERKSYEAAAIKDKQRYTQEMEAFRRENPSAMESHNRTKKNHVKKPSSAYGIFLKEATAEIKKDSPKLLMADVLKIVSYRWKNLSEDEKFKYQEAAKKEKEQSQVRLGQNLLKSHNISVESLIEQAKAEKLEKSKKRIKRETSDSASTNSNSYSLFTPSYQQDSTEDLSTVQNNSNYVSFNSFDDGFLSPLPSNPVFEPIYIPELQIPSVTINHDQEWNLPSMGPTFSRGVSKENEAAFDLPNLPDIFRSTSEFYMDALNNSSFISSDNSHSFDVSSPKLSLDRFPSINLNEFNFQEDWINSFQH